MSGGRDAICRKIERVEGGEPPRVPAGGPRGAWRRALLFPPIHEAADPPRGYAGSRGVALRLVRGGDLLAPGPHGTSSRSRGLSARGDRARGTASPAILEPTRDTNSGRCAHPSIGRSRDRPAALRIRPDHARLTRVRDARPRPARPPGGPSPARVADVRPDAAGKRLPGNPPTDPKIVAARP